MWYADPVRENRDSVARSGSELPPAGVGVSHVGALRTTRTTTCRSSWPTKGELYYEISTTDVWFAYRPAEPYGIGPAQRHHRKCGATCCPCDQHLSCAAHCWDPGQRQPFCWHL